MSSATEALRRMLDERGVEWTYGDGTVSFSDGNHWCHAWAYNDDTMCVSMGYFTPEQAVAATLGNESDDAAMVRLHERMNAVLLGYERAQGIEKRDGDGEVVVPFVAEMHRLIEEAATLGAGTCKVESSVAIEFNTLISPDYYEFEMSCGYRFSWSDNEPPDHCPGCGRKVMHDGS